MPLFLLLACLTDLHAQTLAVKSDLLAGALSSPNLSVEVKLSDRFTLEAGFHYNPFPAGGALVRTARTALLDVPALRRSFLRHAPDVRSI